MSSFNYNFIRAPGTNRIIGAEILTDNLYLRSTRLPGDYATYTTLASNPENTKYYQDGKTWSPDTVRKRVDRWAYRWVSDTKQPYGNPYSAFVVFKRASHDALVQTASQQPLPAPAMESLIELLQDPEGKQQAIGHIVGGHGINPSEVQLGDLFDVSAYSYRKEAFEAIIQYIIKLASEFQYSWSDQPIKRVRAEMHSEDKVGQTALESSGMTKLSTKPDENNRLQYLFKLPAVQTTDKDNEERQANVPAI